MNLFMIFVLSISLIISTESYAGKCRLYHKVKKGESLWTIADRYNLYIRDILKVNPKLRKKKYLRIGERICIPYKKRIAKRKKDSYILYRVRPGDSLQKIGKKFGVSWKRIKKYNKLRSNVIRVGQVLKIPKRSSRKIRRSYRKKDVVYIKYRVRRGDSLQKIGKKFGVSWKRIKIANGLKSDLIRIGQILKIPVPKKVFERRYVNKPRLKLAFLPVNGKYKKETKGLNIYAPCGSKIRSVDNGRVIYSGNDLTPYGNMIIIEHKGYLSIYAFNMQNLVERGERVSRGEIIAKVGMKPGSSECALHFEIRAKDGSVLNPLEFLSKK